MGFLHKLWDETLAGPTPDSGLGKLRKYDSFNGTTRASAPGHVMDEDEIPVSRSITIVRSNPGGLRKINVLSSGGSDSASLPSSPAASSTPHSPLSPSTPGGNVKKFTKKKPKHGEPKSPTGYDWIVLSALDR